MLHLTLVVYSLLSLGLTQGSLLTRFSFVQTGNDVTLDLTDPADLEDYIVLQWKDNNDKVLVSVKPKGEVRVNSERVKYNPQNYSVTLKNLQKEHSGLYEAQLIKDSEQIVISKFNITVLDPVSPVKLTVDSVRTSSESCNFTVSCTTQDFTISSSFSCFNQSCDDQHGNTKIPPSDAPLHLYLTDVSIFCNHSNQVSWTRDVTDIRRVCQRKSNYIDEPEKFPWEYVLVGVAGGVLIIVFIAVVVLYRRKQKNKIKNTEDTVYEMPKISPESPPGATSVESPSSTYSLVGPHSGHLPESLYASVKKPSGPETINET